MTKTDFIFGLIRSALWQKPHPHFAMAGWQYKEVMQYAERQCVMGLVTDCLRTNDMELPKKCVINLLKLQNAMERENKILEDNVASLTRLLDGHHIPHVVVKGQTLAALYPKPRLRIPGDIDFYVSEKDMEKVMKVIQEAWDIKIKQEKKEVQPRHLPFKYNNSTFEMHFKLALFPLPRHQRYLDELVDDVSTRTTVNVGGTAIPVLQPTLNVFYTFIHLYHHLRKEGVALRQLCDVVIMLDKLHDSIDTQLLKQMLDAIGYRKAFGAFGCIFVDKLGLDEQKFPVSIGKSERKWGKKILDDILLHGNWGKYEREHLDKKTSVKRSLHTGRLLFARYAKYLMLTPADNVAFFTRYLPKLMIGSIKKNLRRK
ncbi:MAG: nucleotidyltransferase family protein [Prevotella sp.]|nr:nucleotidyltransferase family protein [Prevotella sp.]